MVEPIPLRRPPSTVPPVPATNDREGADEIRDLRFGRFELQVAECRLLVEGRPVPLHAKALDVLIVLAGRPGRLTSRADLMERVWPGVIVEDNNLSVQVNALRKVLGGERIATVPGRGYRFLGDADLPSSPSSPASSSSHAPTLAAVTPIAGATRLSLADAVPTTPARHTHLADVLPPLIGREAELAELAGLVDRHPLVTLVGAGGMGKTHLAQALLHARRGDYLHGVCFVELGALTRPDALPETIAAALGLRLPEDDDAPAALARTVASLTMLIALDNAEHLLEAVGACAGTLLRTAPGVRLLVTSQVPLRVAQEVLCPLGALAVPSTAGGAREALAFGAVALFMARARAQAPRFVLDDGNVAGVVEVCRRLDGAALAIELAAARLSLLGLHGLLSSLSQPLALLTKGRPDAPARQRTLRAALQWSHDLLAPDEQAVFRRLSVFAGSATLPMIRQVLTDVGDEGGAGHVAETVARTEEAARGRMDSWAVLEALGGLVDRSMAYTVSTGCGVDDIPRYGLLDTPRALAAERLGASGEAPALRARHAGALGALMAQVFDDLIEGPRGLDEIRDALWPDLDNAQAALGWARTHDATLALVIASTLSLVLGRERHAERVTLWREVEPLLDDAAGVPDAVLGRACRECAEHWATTRTAHARERAMQAHALAVQAGDLRAAYLAAGTLAPVSWRLGDLPTIQFAFDVVRAAGTPAWSPFVLAQGAATRAWHCTLTKDTHGALHGFGEQARLCRAAGMDDVRILNNVAGIHLSVGQTAEAIDILQALAGRVASDRDPYPLALTLSNLSASLLAEGRAAQAREVVRQSWPLARQYEMHPQWADDAALIAALEGRAQAALRLAGFADREFERLGQPREAVDQVRIDRAVALASRALSATHDPEALSRLRAAGATLTLDELPTLAFDADSSRINRH